MRTHVAVAAALWLAVGAVYAQVWHHERVDYDDPVVALKIQPGLGAEGLRNAFAGTVVSNWIPLSMLSWLAGESLHGPVAGAHLVTNAVIHAGAATALYAALVGATASVAPAAWVAAVFALHPLHVESVAWFAQRKDVLCALFWFLVLGIHVGGGEAPSLRRRAAVWGLGGLAMLAKPMAVTLPFTLLLADAWPARRLALSRWGLPPARDLARRATAQAPLFAAAAAIALVTYRVQSATGAVAEMRALDASARVSNALLAVGAYLRDAVWPEGLAVFYPHAGADPSATALTALALLGVAVSVALARSASARPYAWVGWLWFLGTLVPVLGVVQVGEQARADRYTYVPLVGLAFAVAYAADALLREASAAARRATAALALTSLVVLGLAAHRQVGTWRDSRTLFARAVAVTQQNAFAERALGRALLREGALEEARQHLGRAVELRPRHAASRGELAEVLAAKGEIDAAIVHYAVALEEAPDDLRTRINRAQLLLRAGRTAEALRDFERVQTPVRLGAPLAAPFRRALHFGLARAYAAEGRAAAATLELDALERLAPNHGGAAALRAQLAGAQPRSDTSSSTESSPGTPTRNGKP